jgi:undecaprenyl-diphosphatase
VASLSFPSGHALRSALIYMTLATLLARATPNHAAKRYIIIVAAVLTCVIGLSRIFLGVHYLTDVLGGWAVGLVWALACGIIARKLQRLRWITPKEGSSI